MQWFPQRRRVRFVAELATPTEFASVAETPRDQASARGGYTLLELILALSLSALIMMAIGMALDLHLRALNTHSADLEDAQIARAVLRHIADDLRGAIRYEPPDLSGVNEFAGGMAQDAASSLGVDADVDAMSSLLPGFSFEGLGEETASSAMAIDASTAPPSIPGLYGNQYQLQVDVSRLPRPHEFYLDPLTGMALPSDVKTVAYYVQSPDSTAAAMYTASFASLPGQSPAQYGLVRREMDRAVSTFAAESGGAAMDLARGEIIAPEVKAIEFAYWDGATWLTEWDSDLNGGLPLAVDVAIRVSHEEEEPVDTFGLQMAQLADDPLGGRVFHLVVKLPLGGASSLGGDPTQIEETTEEGTPEEGTTDDSSAGGASSGGNTGGSTAGGGAGAFGGQTSQGGGRGGQGDGSGGRGGGQGFGGRGGGSGGGGSGGQGFGGRGGGGPGGGGPGGGGPGGGQGFGGRGGGSGGGGQGFGGPGGGGQGFGGRGGGPGGGGFGGGPGGGGGGGGGGNSFTPRGGGGGRSFGGPGGGGFGGGPGGGGRGGR
jgi:hypothetical protein